MQSQAPSAAPALSFLLPKLQQENGFPDLPSETKRIRQGKRRGDNQTAFASANKTRSPGFVRDISHFSEPLFHSLQKKYVLSKHEKPLSKSSFKSEIGNTYRLYKPSSGITQVLFILTCSSSYRPDNLCKSFPGLWSMTLQLPGSSSSKSCAEAASFTICKKNCLWYATNDEDEKRKKIKVQE